MAERLRWRIARLMDRLKGQCWADLVSWVLDSPRLRAEKGRLPWRPVTSACFAVGCERCYCGKKPAPVSPVDTTEGGAAVFERAGRSRDEP